MAPALHLPWLLRLRVHPLRVYINVEIGRSRLALNLVSLNRLPATMANLHYNKHESEANEVNRQQRRLTTLQVFVQILAGSTLTMLGFILVACATAPEAASVPKVLTPLASATVSLTSGATLTGQATAPVTSTPPPLITMPRTMIPGTQAPTRIPDMTTPEYYPTLGLGDPNRESAADTRVAQNDSARWTAEALTPSSTPGSPTVTDTPEPTATDIIGSLDCGPGSNSYENQYESCWNLMMNGHLYDVRSGREGRGGDMGQGVINIRELGPDDTYHDIATYLTPWREGHVEIAAIDGSRVYLVQSETRQPRGIDVTPIPNFVFVFDLETDQWVNP